jgi:hypothetical protein
MAGGRLLNKLAIHLLKLGHGSLINPALQFCPVPPYSPTQWFPTMHRLWLQLREDYLKKQPMVDRQQTYAAISKLLATLDDPFTRFLPPERLTALRRGTQGRGNRVRGGGRRWVWGMAALCHPPNFPHRKSDSVFWTTFTESPPLYFARLLSPSPHVLRPGGREVVP